MRGVIGALALSAVAAQTPCGDVKHMYQAATCCDPNTAPEHIVEDILILPQVGTPTSGISFFDTEDRAIAAGAAETAKLLPSDRVCIETKGDSHANNGIAVYGKYVYTAVTGAVAVRRLDLVTGEVVVRKPVIDGTVFVLDDVTVENGKLYTTALWGQNASSAECGAIAAGSLLSIPIDEFESGTFTLISKSLGAYTNPVNSDANTVVTAVAFGFGTGLPNQINVYHSREPTSTCDADLCPDTFVKSFNLVYPGTTTVAYTNNFAMDGDKLYVGLSTGGGTINFFNSGVSTQGYKFGIVNLKTEELTVLEDMPGDYALGIKRINSRTFILSEHNKIYERHDDGSYTLIKDVQLTYNNISHKKRALGNFATTDPLFNADPPMAFIDNLAVSEHMGKIYFHLSAGFAIISFAIPL